jgi:putative spermidine/putrescine transport system ATP-binding protein
VASPAELYEHPATPFVAGFVGTSNLIDRDGRSFSLRPEKVHIVEPDAPARDGFESAAGRIADVVYLGMVTRYIVEADDGTRILAVKQNLETSSQDALDQRGRRVRVEWRREHMLAIDSNKSEGGG